MDYALEKEIEKVAAWRSSLEGKYGNADRRRLREYKNGGVTEDTAQELIQIDRDLGIAYNKHMTLLERRKQSKKKSPTYRKW